MSFTGRCRTNKGPKPKVVIALTVDALASSLSAMDHQQPQWSLQSHCFPIFLNALKPRENRRHFADNIFKYIFLDENVLIPLRIWLKFASKVPINNIPTLVQIMACRPIDAKPLSELMLLSLLTRSLKSCGISNVNTADLLFEFLQLIYRCNGVAEVDERTIGCEKVASGPFY